MAALSSEVLRMTGVSKDFPSPQGVLRVLDNISLSVQSGEFIGITGPSGSGKSTLLNLAGLLDVPTTGQVLFEGQPVHSQNERPLRQERIGMVFQRFHLLPERSVLDNVLFRFRYSKEPPEDRKLQALEWIERLGLADLTHKPVNLLSGGEMQRVAVARAAVIRPALLLADEPTGNLDRTSGEEVMKCLAELNQQGVTIMVATHNLAWLPYCSKHYRCHGKLLEEAAAA